MAVKVAELYETLELRDSKFKRGMGSAKKQSGGLMKMLGTAGLVGATVGVGAAFAGMAKKGVTAFIDLEKGMAEVFTLMPEASQEATEQMTQDIRDFSKEMGVATDEAVPALYQAISAGVPKNNVFNFMEEAQKAAVAGVTDLKTSVDVLTSVVNTYGADTMSAKKASDIMFTAVKEGKTTFSELSANMSDVAPIASSMGIEFSNVAAALSTMTSQGTPTAKATTQLKQAMAELSKEGTKAGTTFRNVAGKDFQTFITEGGNLQEAMVLMETAAKENGTTISNMFGSIEAGQAALALTGKGAQKFKEDLDAMKTSAGATGKAYTTMEGTTGRALERLTILSGDLFESIGEKLGPAFNDFVDFLIKNMPTIKSVVVGAFEGIMGAFKKTIEVVGTILEKVKPFTDWVKENSDVVIPALAIALTAVAVPAMYALATSIGAAMIAAAPITAVILGITAAITGGMLLWKKYGDNIKQFLIAALNKTKETIKTVGDTITSVATTISEKITDIKDNFVTLKNDVVQTIKDMTNGIKETLFGGLNKAKEKVSSWVKSIGGFFTGLYDKVVGNSIVPDMIDEINTEFEGLSTSETTVRTFKNNVIGWMQDLADDSGTAADSFAGSIVDMVDAVTSGQKTMKEALKGILLDFITMLEKQVIATQIAEQAKALMMAPLSFGATLAAIPGILAAAAPALIGFETIKAGIRGLAEGGTLTSAGSVLVGESGPELLNLPKGASVAPLGKASSGPKSINVMVQLDGKTIAKAVEQPLTDRILVKGGVRM